MTMRNPESIAGIRPEVTEFAALDEAASAVLGYFTHLRYNHYLCVLDHAFERWRLAGLVGDEFRPTIRGAQRFWFDFSLFDLQKFCYALGVYQQIAISHSVANAYIDSEAGQPRTLYLRGFDFESAVDAGGGMAMGLSTADSFMFNGVIERLRALRSHRDIAGRIAHYILLLREVEPQASDARVAINEMTMARRAVDRYFATKPIKAQQPEIAHGR